MLKDDFEKLFHGRGLPETHYTLSLREAIDYHKKGMIKEAEFIYRSILNEMPKDPETLHLLGLLESEKGNHHQAISLISRAIKVAPNQPEFYFNLGNSYSAIGFTEKAIACYRKSVTFDPNFMMAQFNLSVAYREKGLLDKSEATLKILLEANPDYSDAWCLLGEIFDETKKFDESIACFERAIEINPHLERAWFFVGNANRIKNDYTKAEACYRRALDVDSDFVECLNNLGLICFSTGRLEEAIHYYEKVIRRQPDFSEAYCNLGNVFSSLGRREEAIRSYRKALELKPGAYESMVNLGKLYHENGDCGNAYQWYQNALSVKPNNWRVIEQLGNLRRMTGDSEGALSFYQRALAIRPDAYSVFVSIGNTYRNLKKMEKAILAYRNALEHNSESLTALNNLAVALSDAGKTEEALLTFDTILEIRDDFPTRIKKAMTLPIIYPSNEAIDDTRRQFKKKLDKLATSNEKINDPLKQIGLSNFIVALHGREDEKQMRQKLFSFYKNICPDLLWTSPCLRKKRTSGRISIGMVCDFFRDHTIGRLYRGIIEKIDKTKFKVFIFRFDRLEDETAKAIHDSVEQVVYLKKDLKKDRARIAEYRLDILFYPEIGMDPLTYYLSFSRLAPVQCKKGFPITSGVPTVDYFISHEASEPSNGQDYYTETLIRLKSPGYYYYRPSRKIKKPDRAAYGLPDSARLYACLQSPFKIHPEQDAVIAQILRNDENAILLLMEGMHHNWKDKLVERLQKKLGDVIDRVIFLPSMPREQFVALFLMADAVIDSFYFSGGNTSLECFAMGIPVVTWPSPMLPGRLTYGFYRQMGILDCVAKDHSAYVSIAHRLANDCSWRQEVGKKILERSSILYENINNVVELESFFEKAANSVYQ